MTDIASALAAGSLPEYGGSPVARTTISIRNAGDGLSQGLAIDPTVLPIGSTQYVVLECVVHGHDHDRILDRGNDTGLLVLDQVLKAGTGTLIDPELVQHVVAAQAEKITRAKEAAAGVARLPYPDELDKAHDNGDHTDLVEGCPQCDSEVAAEQDEEGA